MKQFAAFIAEMRDVDCGAEQLPELWKQGHPGVHIHEFEVPKGTDSDTIVLVARGLFFQSGWAMQDTLSTVVEDMTDDDQAAAHPV